MSELYLGKTSELLSLRYTREVPEGDVLGTRQRSFLRKIGANLVGIVLSTADSEFLTDFVMGQKNRFVVRHIAGQAAHQKEILGYYFQNLSAEEISQQLEVPLTASQITSSIKCVREFLTEFYTREDINIEFQQRYDTYFGGLIFADAFSEVTED